MRTFMGFQSKRELLQQTRARYGAVKGQAKSTILDEFVSATGYGRKYAIRLLRGPILPLAVAIKRPRTSKYAEIQEALTIAWQAADCICSKRLVPYLPELVPLLEDHGHLALTEESRKLLVSVSAATADRLLIVPRQRRGFGGISTTKPGTLLKHQIRVRTFSDWEDARIGFFEVDLVAHCGETVAGTFLWSLVMTDVASGWTECYGLLRRNGKSVVRAIKAIQKRLPFRILGMDTDNGGEFINGDVLDFCKAEEITFTRGRAYRKNDQCFVEQKNGSIVRHLIGYDRYDGEPALQQLLELYRTLRLYVNFYQPSMKLKAKSREGAKVHRIYSRAQTPLKRLFATDTLLPGALEQLERSRRSMDPIRVLNLLKAQRNAFCDHAILSLEKPGPLMVCDLEPTDPTKTRPKVPDPFAEVEEQLVGWYLDSPEITARALLTKLQAAHPNKYADSLLAQLSRKRRGWAA